MNRFDRTTAKTGHARALRATATDCERLVWSRLRAGQLGASFRRQHPMGRYVLDFYCAAAALAVELDGGQHNDPAHVIRDERRNAFLAGRGIAVLRFWNSDVMENLDGVMETILQAVTERRALRATPSQPPPFRGRGTPEQ